MKPVTHLELFLTENCNLRCRYCFAANSEQQNIAPELAYKAVDFLFEHSGEEKALQLSFWGGEPLLSFGLIKELVNYSTTLAKQHNKQISFALPTNATLLTAEILDFLEQHSFTLSLSLDGDKTSQDERQTKQGTSSFPLVMRSLKLLQEHRKNRLPFIRKTVTPANAGRLYADLRFFLYMGYKNFAFSPVLEADWDDKALTLFAAGQQQLTTLWMSALKYGQPLHFQSWEDILIIRELKKQGKFTALPEFLCGAGSGLVAVDIHGRIYPCHRFVFYDRAKGNTLLGTLEQGINPAAREPYCTPLTGSIKSGGNKCRQCPAAGICNAICPATNYLFTGNIRTAGSRVCTFFKTTANVLDFLEAQAGSSGSYQQYVDTLVKSIRQPYSRFRRLVSQSGDAEQLTNRAQAILRDLGDKQE